MTALNGGLPKAKSQPFTGDSDFLNRFLANLTDKERRIVVELPPIPRRTQLACVIVEMRETPRPELPDGHPLRRAET